MTKITKMVVIIILLNSVITNLHSQTAQKTPRDIAKSAFLSTVLLTMEDVNGQPLSLGSGFVLDNGVVVTNFHVIENSKGGIVKIIGDPKKYKISGIIEIDKKNDIAILSVSGLIAPKVKIGDYSTVGVGDNIYAVGNPRGLEGTFSQGIVSGIRDFEGEKLLQITAPISPGSSGGPILNSNGEVIGVAVATIQNGQNLNFAIPITFVKNLYQNSTKKIQPYSIATNTTNISINNLGTNIKDEIIGNSFAWGTFWSNYTFSVKNNLDYDIKDVYCLVIFYDKDNQPFEIEYTLIKEIIPSKLAKRSKELGRNEKVIKQLTKSVEIRILDFKIVE